MSFRSVRDNGTLRITIIYCWWITINFRKRIGVVFHFFLNWTSLCNGKGNVCVVTKLILDNWLRKSFKPYNYDKVLDINLIFWQNWLLNWTVWFLWKSVNLSILDAFYVSCSLKISVILSVHIICHMSQVESFWFLDITFWDWNMYWVSLN